MSDDPLGQISRSLIQSRPPEIVVSPAEHSALLAIVSVLVAKMAAEHQALGRGSPQAWINEVSGYAQEAIMGGTFAIGDEARTQQFKGKVLEHINEHINRILGGVHFPQNGDDAS